MDVQLFTHPKSQASRKAERFFAERRVRVHVVDVRRKPPSPGELKRWVQRFGAQGVLDPEAKAYREQGLQYVSASDDDWIARMVRDPSILRLPLGRCGTQLTVGDDPEGWQQLADAAKA